MQIQTLIFDMDDTLVIEEASAEAAFLEACQLATDRFKIDPEMLHKAVRQTCRELWHQSPARAYCIEIGISSWEGLWAQFLGDDENHTALRDWAPSYRLNSWYAALLDFGIDDRGFAAVLSTSFIENRRKRHIPFDDSISTLKKMKKRYKLGLLTNGVPDIQRDKIRGSQIGDYFEAIIISGEVGYGKPDRRIFEYTLNQLDAEPDETVMIGNSLRSDIATALDLNLVTIWLNRNGQQRGDSIVPDYEIKSLFELESILNP